MKRLQTYLPAMGCILVCLGSEGWASTALTLGQTQTGTMSAAAQVDSYTFNASANDVVSLTVAATNGSLSPQIQLLNSAGTLLDYSYPMLPGGSCSGAATQEMNTFLLTAAGTYTVKVSDCTGTNTGNYVIYGQLSDNPSGAVALAIGSPNTAAISSAAQSDSYTFSASVNQFVTLAMTATSGALIPRIRLYNSAGTQLTSAYPGSPGACTSGSSATITTYQLPSTGTYTVLASDCGDTNTGGYQISAQLAGANPVPSLPAGEVDTGTISSTAQSNRYSVAANANDVAVWTVVTTSGSFSPKLQLYSPTGTSLLTAFPLNCCGGCSGGATLETSFTFPTSGVYTVIIGDCEATNTGGYALYTQITDTPSGAANIPLATVPAGLINSTAQSNTYTFSANANDVVDFTIDAISGALSPKIRLYSPAGALLHTAFPVNCCGGCSGGATLEMNTVTIPASGIYSILVGDCSDTNAGNYVIYAQRTNNPSGSSAILWGQVQPGRVASEAQSTSYTFTGTANAAVNFEIVTTSGSFSPKIRLYNPDGTQASQAYPVNCCGGCSGGGTVQMSSVTLTQNGIYTVLVGDCSDTNTGTYNLSSECFGTCSSAAPLINSVSPTSATAGGTGFTLTVNGSNFFTAPSSTVYWNGGPLTTTYVNSTQLTAAVPPSEISAAGSFPITVENPTPSVGPSNAVNFTVAGGGAGTINFPPISNQVYGAAPFTISATSSSGSGVSFNAQTTAVCTVSGTTVTIVSAGTCTIQAASSGAATVSQSFQVTQASQTITFGTITNREVFSAPFSVSATASSGLAVGFNSQTTLVCSVSGTTVTPISVGTCTIQATQAGNIDYLAATPSSQSFQVTQASQTIAFGTLSNQVFGIAPFGVSASASSGLAVSFSSQTPAVCTVSNTTVTLVSAGSCTIQATQAGNADYLAAPFVNQTFQVNQAPQVISFGTLPNQSLGAAPFTVSATAASGLPVSFSSLTGSCTVSGTTVTLVSAGTCTIQATQAGNTDYSAAMPVSRSFLITQVASPTLTVGSVSVAPGAAFSVPITLSLTGGVSADTLTFGIKIAPVGNAPALTGSLTYTNSSAVTATPVSATDQTANEISVLWASISSPFSGVVTLGFVGGTLPAGTTSGESYQVMITAVSAANGGGTNAINVTPGANGSIVVASTYLVGDIAPYTSDTVPNFGSGQLNIVDLVNELLAVNNVGSFRPAACSDRFDAADTFPEDTPTTRGGDGVLDIRDLVVELFRVNNLDTSRPTRASLGGCVSTSSTTSASTMTAAVRKAEPKRIPRSEADGVLSFGDPEPLGQSRERVPVYLQANHDLAGVALTFAVGDQQSALDFQPASVNPSLTNSQQPGVAAVAWLDGISLRAAQRLLLGYVEAPVGTAPRLQLYGFSAVTLADNQEVRLAAPDGAGSSR